MNKKILFVGRDAASSGCFIRLAPVLEKQGYTVTMMVGNGKPLAATDDDIINAVKSADLVVSGMSSSAELAKPEVLACQTAKEVHIPFGFYGDVPECFMRARAGAWFEPFALHANFYFSVNTEDAQAAKVILQNAKTFGTGNPLREESAFPKFTREEVREKLGVLPDEKLILVPGGKFVAANLATWTVVMDALHWLTAEGGKFQLVLTTHPGDRLPYCVDSSTEKPVQCYEELISNSPVSVELVAREVLTTTDIVTGADLVIDYGGSTSINAAYQSVPLISLGFGIWHKFFEKENGKITIPEAVVKGLARPANMENITGAIRQMLTQEGFATMKAIQQQLCPKPTEQGLALKKMAEAITEILQ